MSQQFMNEMVRKLQDEEITPEDVMAHCQQHTRQLAREQAKQFLEQTTEIEFLGVIKELLQATNGTGAKAVREYFNRPGISNEFVIELAPLGLNTLQVRVVETQFVESASVDAFASWMAINGVSKGIMACQGTVREDLATVLDRAARHQRPLGFNIQIMDSHRLADLMVENQVQVKAQTYQVYRLDTH